MLPLLATGLLSAASDAVQNWMSNAQAKTAALPPQNGSVNFEAALKKAALAGASQALQMNAAAPGTSLDQAANNFLQTPEVKAGLGTVPSVQSIQISAAGEVSTAGTKLSLSPEAQAAAKQLYAQAAGQNASLLTPINMTTSTGCSLVFQASSGIIPAPVA